VRSAAAARAGSGEEKCGIWYTIQPRHSSFFRCVLRAGCGDDGLALLANRVHTARFVPLLVAHGPTVD
jgi:hypothetical protein